MLEGHALLNRMPWHTPVIGAGYIRIVPSGEGRLVDLLGIHHSHLVADKGWLQVSIRHWYWGEFRGFSFWEIPPRVGACVGIGVPAGRDFEGNKFCGGGLCS